MNIRMGHAVAIVVMAMATGPLARAEKPDAPGNSGGRDAAPEQAALQPLYFTADRIASVRQYYAQHDTQHPGGGCPPGLAKKNNGCMPPGQAKKWRRGEPLPPDIVYGELPGDLVVVLGGLPAGRKVVRVDEDLLLISIATGMVLESLEL